MRGFTEDGPGAETFNALSHFAKEVMGQLFVNGPIYDRYIISKSGRDELEKEGMIERRYGFQWLNIRGVYFAINGDIPITISSFRKWSGKQVL